MPKSKIDPSYLPEISSETQEALLRALEKNEKSLLARAGVVNVGIGYAYKAGQPTDELALIAAVSEKLPLARLAKRDRVPPSLGGVRVDVVEHNPVPAFDPHARHSPLLGGIRITTALGQGTLGCVVFGRNSLAPYGLTARHVLLPPIVFAGDPNIREVWQPNVQPAPAPQDSGIGNLVNADAATDSCIITIDGTLASGAPPLFDMRTRPLSTAVADQIVPRSKGIADAVLGMRVRKAGQTTGVTHGIVDQILLTPRQFRIAPDPAAMSSIIVADLGDSGSVVYTAADGHIVGLLTHNNATVGATYGIASPIRLVLEKLGCFIYNDAAGLWADDTEWIGGTGQAFAIVAPFEQATLAVYYPSGRKSSAKGLGKKQADANGFVGWNWRIGTSTKRRPNTPATAALTRADGALRLARFELDGRSNSER